MTISLEELNDLPADRAAALLSSCCGAGEWVSRMVALRPFASREALASSADVVWKSLSPADWREAFAHHPRIGARGAPAAATEQSRAWSAGEQGNVDHAGDATRTALAEANAAYEGRFGFTYIVRAAGRTAEDMLELARRRLANDPETELRVAAEQQREIMHLRLEKLLSEDRR